MTNTQTDTNELVVSNTVEALAEQRRRWEAGAFAASNSELYALLGQTLDLLYRIKDSVELARGLAALLEERGFKLKAGTSIEVKLIRAIFVDAENPDRYRNRLFGYARVLNVAHKAGITGADLPQFITEHGGIDEIRRHDPSNGSKADAEKAQIYRAEATFTAPSFNPIMSGIALRGDLVPASDEHFSIALVRRDARGTGSIVFGTNNSAVLRAVLKLAGRKLDEEAELERERMIKAKADAEKKEAIAAVSAELNGALSTPKQSALEELEAELAD